MTELPPEEGYVGISIADIGSLEGKRARISGWVYNKRSSGKIIFLIVRDGTGVIQCVGSKADLGEESFERLDKINQESSIIVEGTVRKDPRAPSGYEIGLERYTVVSEAFPEYPITLKEHGIEFLLDNRHLWIRTPRQRSILAIRAEVERACRDFLDGRGFVEVDAPILTPSACEGTTTLFSTEYFGEKAYLSQSGQLYNEAAIMSLGKVYCFGPAFRAEKSKTRRHLIEFWMVEPEAAFMEFQDLLKFEEEMVAYVVGRVLERRSSELKQIGRDPGDLEDIKPPFPRITYDEAISQLKKAGFDIEVGDDFGAPHESYISSLYKRPVFVTHYPTKIKAFYMKPDPQNPERVLGADLLAPEGYGEIIGGGERISDYDLMLQRFKEYGLSMQDYGWYLDLRKYGSVPHSGFGMGIERLLAWICHLDHVRESIPFPRMLTRLRP